MGRVQAIIKKLDKVLTKFNISERVLYKRIRTRTGGDPLLGTGAIVTMVDTLVEPPPVVAQLNADGALISNGTSIVHSKTNLVLMLSPSSISREDLISKDLMFVFKYDDKEEVYVVVGYDAQILEGTVAMYTVEIRSVSK